MSPPDPALPRDSPALVSRLRAAGCVFAEDEARLLLSEARDPADLEAMVARRVAGTPLEQVLGWAEFCGLRIAVSPGVFVPRRRTGFLVELGVGLTRRGGVIVELCCGSGAVAAAVAAASRPAELHAVDIDPVAVGCARRTLAPYGGQVHLGDLDDPLPRELAGRVDLLVANAPYVPSGSLHLMPPEARDHEPRVALDGGPDGVDVQRRVAAAAPRWLAPGGHLLVETSGSQAGLTAAAVTAAGLAARVERCADRDATVVVGAAPSG